MSENRPTFWQILKSTLGAAFGVQSSKTYERDAGQRSIAPYVAAGIIFTVIFIISVVAVVKIVLKTAGVQ